MNLHVDLIRQKIASGRAFFLFKALITVSLCSLIVWKGDWENIWNALKNTDPFLIVIVFVGMLLGVAISAYKWRLVLSVHGIHFAFSQLHRYYYTAAFFNNFLPSNIGGDVYRIFQTIRNQPNRTGAVAAVFIERITGIWALIGLGAIGAMIVCFRSPSRPAWIPPVFTIFSIITALPPFLILIFRRFVNWCITLQRFPQKIKNVLILSRDYHRHLLKSFQIIIISFCFHLFTLAWMLVLVYAVGGISSISHLVLGIAISNLAALLPISINGIGLFDGSFIYVMAELGMEFDAALMMMLVIRALLIALSLIGGLFYLQDRKEVNVKTIHATTSEIYKDQTC